MNNLIITLAQAREDHNQAQAAQKDLLDNLMNSDEWKALEASRAFAAEQIRQAESDIKNAAMSLYEKEGNKMPHEAVQVKEFTVFHYDETKAVEYCKKFAPVALKTSLDKRMFKGIAEKTDLPFVQVKKESRIQIASNLQPYRENP